MARAKKKTPKSKKRKQLASSFKKQNLTPTGSGKNFKKSRSAAKRKQNLSSASAFNASGLSPSKASTPLVKPGRPKSKRNIVDNVFKGNRPAQSPATDEKAPPSTPSTSATANNVESPCPTFPTPVPSVGQDLKNLNDYIARRGQDEFQEVPVQAKTKPTLQDLARNKNSRKRKRVRCGPGPPKGKVLKGDLGDMFRNSHITPIDNPSLQLNSSVCTRAPSLFGGEVIVIDDDDDDEEGENKCTVGEASAVESLGEEMLELVGGNGGSQDPEVGWGNRFKSGKAFKQPVPVTPKTFLKNLNFQQQREDVDSKKKESDKKYTVVDEVGQVDMHTVCASLLGSSTVSGERKDDDSEKEKEAEEQWTVVDELGQVDCESEREESTSGQEGGGNDTIVIDDDTLEEGQLDDSNADEVVVLESPLSVASMQEVVMRYPAASEDFIPIESPRQAKRKAANMQRKEMGRGRGKGRASVPHTQPPGPRFRMDRPGGQNHSRGGRGVQPGPPRNQFRMNQPGGSGLNFNFGGFSAPRGGVFRFGGGNPGRRAGQTQGLQVAKVPTISEGRESGPRTGLRPIVIDGSNVAMAHGKNKVFSAKGIKIVADYFKQNGHRTVVAFVPQFRKKSGQVVDRAVLEGLEEEGVVVFTPSREVDRERITSYDDTFVLDYAAKHGGIVVTKDNYRDLAHSRQEWMEVVKKRILMPTFVGEDEVMWPHDPLGRGGLTLDQFLSF